MSASKPPSVAARRAGYVVAAVVNALLVFAVNVWPGWDVVPFLTEDFGRVLPLANATLLVSMAVNVLFAVRDPAWLKALGTLAADGVGIAATAKMWQVFPLDLSSGWATVARVLLVLAIVGYSIDIIVQLVALAKAPAVRAR